MQGKERVLTEFGEGRKEGQIISFCRAAGLRRGQRESPKRTKNKEFRDQQERPLFEQKRKKKTHNSETM